MGDAHVLFCRGFAGFNVFEDRTAGNRTPGRSQGPDSPPVCCNHGVLKGFPEFAWIPNSQKRSLFYAFKVHSRANEPC